MLYHLYELNHAAWSPARAAADAYRLLFRNPLNPASHTTIGRSAAAVLELFERSTRRYHKPAWDIASTTVDGREVAVHERVIVSKPFCNLVHFERDIPDRRWRSDSKVLLVAPMAGHFPTLLRGTVRDLLPNHEVYVTEWEDARRVPRAAGPFDLDDYIDYILEFIRLFRGDVHVMAVCQPTVPVFAAVSLMEMQRERFVPRSMILMAGPIDARINPTAVNCFAEGTPALLVRAERHHPGALATPRHDAQRLSGIPPAQRLHGHESRPPPYRPPPPVPESGERRWRFRRQAPRILRRVPRGDGPHRRVLSADHQHRVP